MILFSDFEDDLNNLSWNPYKVFSKSTRKKTSDGLCTIRHVVYKRNTRRSDLNAWPFYEVTWRRHVISQNSHCVLTFFREWPVMTYWIDIEIPGMNYRYSNFTEAHFSIFYGVVQDVWNVKLYIWQYRVAESRKQLLCVVLITVCKIFCLWVIFVNFL